jgi:peroxiredoxin
MNRFIALAVSAVFIVAVLIPAVAAERVPNFKLEGVDGKTYELKVIAKDCKVVLIDFWDSSCKPCRKMMPHLQTYYDVYQPAGLEVVVIARDTTLTVSKVKPLVAAEGWTFPVLYDTDQKVSKAYHVKYSPVSYVVSNKGEILFQHAGYKPGQEKALEEAIIKGLGLTEEEVAKLYAEHNEDDSAETGEEAAADEDTATAPEETAPDDGS